MSTTNHACPCFWGLHKLPRSVAARQHFRGKGQARTSYVQFTKPLNKAPTHQQPRCHQTRHTLEHKKAKRHLTGKTGLGPHATSPKPMSKSRGKELKSHLSKRNAKHVCNAACVLLCQA